MAFDPELLKAMKKLASMTPEEIDAMMRELALKSPEEWRLGTNLILLTGWIEHGATRRAVVALRKELADFKRELLEAARGTGATPANGTNGTAAAPPATVGGAPPAGLPAQPPRAVVGAPPPDAVGGNDQGQAEAEAIMDSVAGPRAGGPPSAVVGGQPMPMAMPQGGAGGPRRGADGSVITDPAQLEAESIMDSVIGPR